MKRTTIKIAKKILPAGSKRRRAALAFMESTGFIRRSPDRDYSEWVERFEPYVWISDNEKLKYQPLISIIVPVFNAPDRYLQPMVYSVVNQVYENWELVLVNASTDLDAQERTRQCVNIDSRIKVIEIEENRGIAGNTNAGIDNANGDYIALLDHDDTLSPYALSEVATILQKKPKPQMIYSDEDKLTEDGEYRLDPHFKPDWSPHVLRHVNYMNHFMVIEKSLVDKIGGYRTGLDGAQDFDLFLRIVDEKPIIEHIPKILYHWRAAKNSTAQDFSSKKNILEAGQKALADHLERNNQHGVVGYLEKQPGFYEVQFTAPENVAIIVFPFPNLSQYEYFISTTVGQLAARQGIELYVHDALATVLPKDSPLREAVSFYSGSVKCEILEQVYEDSQANAFLLFEDAVVLETQRWIDSLSGIVEQIKTVGVAAPIVVASAGDSILRAGQLYRGEKAVNLFEGVPRVANSYFGNTLWGRNVDMHNAGVYAISRQHTKKYLLAEDLQRSAVFSERIYQNMRNDKLEIVTMPSVVGVYRGTPKASVVTTFLNPNVVMKNHVVKLEKGVNVPPPEEN